MVAPAGPCKATPGTEFSIAVGWVRPDGSADRAGIRVGDALLRIGHTDIAALQDLPPVMHAFHVGDRTTVVIRRGGTDLTLPIEFTSADVPSPASGPSPASAAPLAPAPAGAQLPGPAAGAAGACLFSATVLPLPDAAAAAALTAGMQGNSAVSVAGDVLTIVHRDLRSDVHVIGSFQLPMGHVAGTDLWLLQLKMPGWDNAFFSYRFYAGSGLPSGVGTEMRFRGPGAPTFPEEQVTLRGRLIRTSLHSRFLAEDRAITVYLPPALAKHPLPALFMMDGQACEEIARVLEPLMLAGRTRPFAIIGVHAAEPGQGGNSTQSDRRQQEYVSGINPAVFERHMQFFTDEVLPWAVKTYGISSKAADRAVFGFSNGADFTLAVAVDHPELFGAALPFSAGAPLTRSLPGQPLPRFFLAAGKLEPPFMAGTRRAYQQLRSRAAAEFTTYTSGHDHLMWDVALVQYMPSVFPPLPHREP